MSHRKLIRWSVFGESVAEISTYDGQLDGQAIVNIVRDVMLDLYRYIAYPRTAFIRHKSSRLMAYT